MLFKIPFPSWADKADLEVEISDDVAPRFQMRAALSVVIGKAKEKGELADLSGTNLSGTNLNGANLNGTDLSDADLSDADLSDADLSDANLKFFKTDLWDVLLRSQPEIPALLATLRAGKIDGSTYSGKCACLAGTVAKTRHCSVDALGFADNRRPIERWFLQLKPGHTPENHGVAKITEAWILEFMGLVGMADTPNLELL